MDLLHTSDWIISENVCVFLSVSQRVSWSREMRECDCFLLHFFLAYMYNAYSRFEETSWFDFDLLSMHNNLEPTWEFASDRELVCLHDQGQEWSKQIK